MLPDYRDITSRIPDPPIWYDEHGVPRYDQFSPRMLGVYDSHAALYEIACQACDRRILVGVGRTGHEYIQTDTDIVLRHNSLDELLQGSQFADPPRHDCVGDTMICNDIRIVEAWTKEDLKWVRHPELEISLQD
jgi:hypothetical protein